MMKDLSGRKIYVAISAAIVWFALCLQFNISLNLANGATLTTLKIFLSYFTVTTNILVGICLLTLWLFEVRNAGHFFFKASTQTAITVYILVVCLTYNIMLRGLIPLSGWPRVADELLHVVDPLLFLGFWIFYTPKIVIPYKNAMTWLTYPVLYVLMTVIRGHLIQQYPYPFIDVTKLGYPRAILNAVLILAIFWLLSLLFIFISRKLAKHA